jgi:hypothetical protein
MVVGDFNGDGKVDVAFVSGAGWSNYGQTQKLGSHAGEPGNPDGEQSITDVMIGHPAPSK